jgi:lipopolysaccharide assembly protein A
MTIVYLLVTLIGTAIALFAIQNIDPVPIRFLVWKRESPLSAVVLLSILIGIVVASLIGLVRHWKLRAKIRQLEQLVADSRTVTRTPPSRPGAARAQPPNQSQ